MNQRNGRPAPAGRKFALPTAPQEFSPNEIALATQLAAAFDLGKVVVAESRTSLVIGSSAVLTKHMALREARTLSGISYLPAAAFRVEVWRDRPATRTEPADGDFVPLRGTDGILLYDSIIDCLVRVRLRVLEEELTWRAAAVLADLQRRYEGDRT
jgi:hypothetical protein